MSTPRKSFVASLAAVALAFSAAAGAQQYKWVDKNGKTQYGDFPPPGVKAVSLKAPSAPPAPPPAAKGDSKDGKDVKKGPLTPAEQEAAFRKRQIDQTKASEDAAKKDQELAQKRDNCARSQESLRSLESGGRISRINAAGEREVLDDSQRAQEVQRARKSVADFC
jgi:hypothetical protein